MGLFSPTPIRAKVTIWTDAKIEVDLAGPQIKDQRSLGALAIGYAAKLYWDTLREDPLVREAYLWVFEYTSRLGPDADVLKSSPLYRAWLEAPAAERVRGTKARYTAKLSESGVVATGLPFRNFAMLHSLSICAVVDAVWSRLDPDHRQALRGAFKTLGSIVASGQADDPSLSALFKFQNAGRDTWEGQLAATLRGRH